MSKKAVQPGQTNLQPCLVCNRPKARLTRGLCDTHYMQFRKAKEAMTDEEIVEFELKLISEGLLLPSRQGQRPKTSNVFEDIANEIRDSAILKAKARAKEASEKMVRKRKGN